MININKKYIIYAFLKNYFCNESLYAVFIGMNAFMRENELLLLYKKYLLLLTYNTNAILSDFLFYFFMFYILH